MKSLVLSLIFLLLALGVLFSQNRDVYENNNSRQSASNIVEGENQEHTIFPARDKDWIQFTSPGLGSYQLVLANQDINLKGVVYMQVGLLPPVQMGTINSPKPGTVSSVLFTPRESGVSYFIGLWAEDISLTGKYEIYIEEFTSRSLKGEASVGTIPTNGLIAYYPFNGNANDESGSGNDGKIFGATTTYDRKGRPNSAFRFNGIDNYIDFGNPTAFKYSQQLTINFWIEYSSFSHVFGIINKHKFNFDNNSWTFRAKDENFKEMMLYADFPSKIHLYLNGRLENNPIAQPLELAQWYQITIVIESLNGSTIGNNSFPLGLGYLELNANNYPQYFFQGLIDDIRIYNRALTNSEVKSLYNE